MGTPLHSSTQNSLHTGVQEIVCREAALDRNRLERTQGGLNGEEGEGRNGSKITFGTMGATGRGGGTGFGERGDESDFQRFSGGAVVPSLSRWHRNAGDRALGGRLVLSQWERGRVPLKEMWYRIKGTVDRTWA